MSWLVPSSSSLQLKTNQLVEIIGAYLQIRCHDAEPFAFAGRVTDVQHVEHAAAHIAQPISETLGAICG
jgi:hypothetical protein